MLDDLIKLFDSPGFKRLNNNQKFCEENGIKDLYCDVTNDRCKVNGIDMTVNEFKSKYQINEGAEKPMYLETLMAAATATNDDEATEALMKMMNPTEDRTEMSDVFSKSIGYDPLVYFDKHEISKKIDEFIDTCSNPDLVRGRKQQLIDIAMNELDETRDNIQRDVIIAAMTELCFSEDLIDEFKNMSVSDDAIDAAFDEEDDDDDDIVDGIDIEELEEELGDDDLDDDFDEDDE